MTDEHTRLAREELEQRYRTLEQTLLLQRAAASRGRRRTDPPGDDHSSERGARPVAGSIAVTYRWLVGVLVAVLIIAGGGWANHMQGQVSDIRAKQEASTRDSHAQSADIAVIKEKLRVIEERQKEASDQTREVNRKLDELLRKAPAK